MSASDRDIRGGQPSTTQPIAGPWLSPQVVTRNRWPKLLWDTGVSRSAVHPASSGSPAAPPAAPARRSAPASHAARRHTGQAGPDAAASMARTPVRLRREQPRFGRQPGHRDRIRPRRSLQHDAAAPGSSSDLTARSSLASHALHLLDNVRPVRAFVDRFAGSEAAQQLAWRSLHSRMSSS